MKSLIFILVLLLISPHSFSADSYSYLESLLGSIKPSQGVSAEKVAQLKDAIKEFISCVRKNNKMSKAAAKIACEAALDSSLSKLQSSIKDISTESVANSIQDLAWGNISRTYYDLYISADGEHLTTKNDEKEFKGPNICQALDGTVDFECSESFSKKAQTEISKYKFKPSKSDVTADLFDQVGSELDQVKEMTKCEDVVITNQTVDEKRFTINTSVNYAISNLNSEERFRRLTKYFALDKDISQLIAQKDSRFGIVNQIHIIKQELVDASKQLIRSDNNFPTTEKMTFLLTNFPRAAGQLLASSPSRKLIEELCSGLPENSNLQETQTQYGDRLIASPNGEILISGCKKDKAGQCIAEAALDDKSQLHSNTSQKICNTIADKYKDSSVSDAELENSKKKFDAIINKINNSNSNRAAFWVSRKSIGYQDNLEKGMSEFLLSDCPDKHLAVNAYIKDNYERTYKLLEIVEKDPKLASMFWKIKERMFSEKDGEIDFLKNRRLINFFTRIAQANEKSTEVDGKKVPGWRDYIEDMYNDFGSKDLDDPAIFKELINKRIKNIVSDQSLRDQCT